MKKPNQPSPYEKFHSNLFYAYRATLRPTRSARPLRTALNGELYEWGQFSTPWAGG